MEISAASRCQSPWPGSPEATARCFSLSPDDFSVEQTGNAPWQETSGKGGLGIDGPERALARRSRFHFPSFTRNATSARAIEASRYHCSRCPLTVAATLYARRGRMRAAAVSVSTALTRVLVPTSLKNSAGDFVGDGRLAAAHAGEKSGGDRGTTASGRWVGRGGATKADFPIRIICYFLNSPSRAL